MCDGDGVGLDWPSRDGSDDWANLDVRAGRDEMLVIGRDDGDSDARVGDCANRQRFVMEWDFASVGRYVMVMVCDEIGPVGVGAMTGPIWGESVSKRYRVTRRSARECETVVDWHSLERAIDRDCANLVSIGRSAVSTQSNDSRRTRHTIRLAQSGSSDDWANLGREHVKTIPRNSTKRP